MSCSSDDYFRKEAFIRSEMLFGEGATERLRDKKVIVFGIGGVGGHAAEAIARSGIGTIALVDHDTVSISNINRQAVAYIDTVGMAKVDVMKEMILRINPDCNVITHQEFLDAEHASEFSVSDYDYVVDAIDTITAKLYLAEYCEKNKIGIISAMGAGNKLDPTRFEVTDIYKTSVCPLAKVMRHELKKRGVEHLQVVYSKEEAKKPLPLNMIKQDKRIAPGSCSFIPSVVGLIMAGVVVRELVKG